MQRLQEACICREMVCRQQIALVLRQRDDAKPTRIHPDRPMHPVALLLSFTCAENILAVAPSTTLERYYAILSCTAIPRCAMAALTLQTCRYTEAHTRQADVTLPRGCARVDERERIGRLGDDGDARWMVLLPVDGERRTQWGSSLRMDVHRE